MTTTPALINFDHLLPEGETLFDYQHVGVAYALVARRTFIADEQGLGKTRQALVAVEADGVFARGGQVVIVCPARLKDNWMREVVRLLPHRSVQILGGKRPYETFADVIIVNYDILSAWGEFLSPEALVLDESHYVKEIKSQRTKAARKLAARVPATGLVLALTGTPILNRPVELFAQLDILGQLRQIAPKPRKGDSDKDWEYAFKYTFCGPSYNGHGWEFKGASNLGRLNEALRSTCFVRRERKAVLGMEETRRIQVPLSLNGALDRYRAAERNLIGFLAAEKGEAAAAKARNAEVLVGLNMLRKLAGEAKVEAAIEWINNFFEENEGRSLVVFASHIEVQQALVAAFPGCSQILGGQRDVEGQKDRFLAGATNLIVCSLQAAREGQIGRAHV